MTCERMDQCGRWVWSPLVWPKVFLTIKETEIRWRKREGKRGRETEFKTLIFEFIRHDLQIMALKRVARKYHIDKIKLHQWLYKQERGRGGGRKKRKSTQIAFSISLMFSPVLSSPASVLFSVSVCHLRPDFAACMRENEVTRKRKLPRS